MRRALLLLALSVLFGACTGDDADTNVPAAASSTTVPDRELPAPLGSGSWSAARTVAGRPHDVLVLFTGGPEYKADNPCTVRYEPRVEETDAEVKLTIVGFSPVDATGTIGCNDVGYFRRLLVTLKQPIGSRRLRDAQFDRVRPVFDGNRLFEPTWLPDGFKLRSEESDYGELKSWTRTWAPDPPASSDDRCVPIMSGFVLMQGEPVVLSGGVNVREITVRGAKASFEAREADSKAVMWNEDGQGFVVSTRPNCADDMQPSDDVLIRFVEGLRKP